MGSFNIADIEAVSTRRELPLKGAFIDPSNLFYEDTVMTVGSEKARLRSAEVNGDDASADTAVARCMFVGRLNNAYVPGSAFTVEPVAHVSRTIATHCKLDVVVRKLDSGGVATGADLCSTGEITMSGTTTPTQQSFACAGTGLVVGDRVGIVVSLSLNDTGAPGASVDAFAYLDRVDVVGSGKGAVNWID